MSIFTAEMLGPSGPKLVAPEAGMIQEGVKLALGELGERLADEMTSSLVLSDTQPVLTSDEPSSWWSPGNAPVGYATASIVWFPLSPRVILQLSEQEVDSENPGLPSVATAAGRGELIPLANHQIAGQAHR